MIALAPLLVVACIVELPTYLYLPTSADDGEAAEDLAWHEKLLTAPPSAIPQSSCNDKVPIEAYGS